MKRGLSILCAVLIAPAFAHAQAPGSTAERGIGPFNLQTRNGPSVVRLLRLEKDMLWVDQRTSDGRYIEVGVPRGTIVSFEIPRLPVVEAASQATTTQQATQVEVPLKRIVDTLKPYRDLPGMPVYEAQLIQGRLLMLQGRDSEAVPVLSDVATNAKDGLLQQEANLRMGLIFSRLGQNEQALAILDPAAFPDDDPELLDDLFAARANARAAMGRHEDALLDYFYPVVFAPHIHRAEPRSLLAALPSLSALEDWAGAARALTVLRTQYAKEPETAKAEEWAKRFEGKLGVEQNYQLPDEQPAEETAEESEEK